MPDWITHILVAWTICTVLGFKFKQFNPANTAICMVGALIPDVYKIVIPLEYLGIDASTLLPRFICHRIFYNCFNIFIIL
ncbi:MAG: hypothetical protein PQ964_03685 [Methanobacteriaceae archaeon]